MNQFVIVVQGDDGSERLFGSGDYGDPWLTTSQDEANEKVRRLRARAAAIGLDVPYEVREVHA